MHGITFVPFWDLYFKIKILLSTLLSEKLDRSIHSIHLLNSCISMPMHRAIMLMELQETMIKSTRLFQGPEAFCKCDIDKMRDEARNIT